MRRLVPLVLLALAACQQAEAPKDAATFETQTIALPAETAALPATPAGELLTINCTSCHSAEMIQQQPPMDAMKWAATVKKMREAYKATYPASDDARLVQALVTLQGAGS